MNALRLELELLCQDQENATQCKERGGEWLDYHTKYLEARNDRRDQIVSDDLRLREHNAALREALVALLDAECCIDDDRAAVVPYARGVLHRPRASATSEKLTDQEETDR